jgi:hypothetical protein
MEPEPTYSEEILKIADDYGYFPAAVAEVRRLPRDELEKLGEAYLVELYHGPYYYQLTPAQDLLAPFLISVLERDSPFTPNAGATSAFESPANRALMFLKNGVHPALKKSLLRWQQKNDREILLRITTPLVSFGSDDLLPAVQSLFEHADEWISSSARGGALEAIGSGRAESGFRDYVWQHAVELLRSAKPPAAMDPIRLLVALDEEATKQVLLDDVVTNPNHALLAAALGRLNSLKCPPAPDILERLLADDTLKDKESIRQGAVMGLILQHHPSGIAYVDKIFHNPEAFDQDTVLAAWNARYHMQGLTPLYDSAFSTFETAKYEMGPLSPDERSIVIIHYLDAEISNGGFWQWYFNEGELADEALKSLEKIGARQHASVIRKANRLFGREGPPKTSEEVQQALRKMSDRTSGKMSDLNDEWFALPTWALTAAAWDWKRQTGTSG